MCGITTCNSSQGYTLEAENSSAIKLYTFFKSFLTFMKNISKEKINNIVLELYHKEYSSELDFVKNLRQVFNNHKLSPLPKATLISTYRQLLRDNIIEKKKSFEQYLIKRAVRTLSGVSVITVLSKPDKSCPHQCVYCPTEPEMPKSYLSNEPAAARAKMNLFDPVKQVSMRIQALENNGHQVDKIEILVLGGTWSSYSDKYQKEFIRDIFYTANTFKEKEREKLSLEEEQKINETARYSIIGLTLETRPDYINKEEIKKLRYLGCTRVQIGVQHTDNKILKLIKRGHTIEDSIEATKLLKETGFKVDHHYMPDLPGSTPEKDLKMFEYIFTSQDLQPDQIKIYPCIVNEYSELYHWFKDKKYKPYSEEELLKLLLKVKLLTPTYVRINRLIRDIPKESITAGNRVTNLRQYLQEELKKQGKACGCLRCREVRADSKEISKAKLKVKKYKASKGIEYFLTYEYNNKVYAFLRLRINNNTKENIFPELLNSSIVRELHVYGKMIPVNSKEITKTQHSGLGKKLMKKAEEITKKNNLNKVSVISGIGVRGYYKKLGYKLEGTYMTKNI